MEQETWWQPCFSGSAGAPLELLPKLFGFLKNETQKYWQDKLFFLINQGHGKPELLHCGLGMKLGLAQSCGNDFNSFSQSLHPTQIFFHLSWIKVIFSLIILVTLLDLSLLKSCDKTRIRWKQIISEFISLGLTLSCQLHSAQRFCSC